MPNPQEPAAVTVELSSDISGREEEIDKLARQLLREIRESGINAEIAREPTVAKGAKAGEMLELGQLLLMMLPAALPKLIAVLNEWLGRGQHRHIKLKMPNGVDFELTGEMSVTDIQKLVETLGSAGPPARVGG